VQIASSLSLSGDDDAMIWKFTSGRFLVQYLYVVINDRGVRQVYLLDYIFSFGCWLTIKL
jgi:hypothetical protein